MKRTLPLLVIAAFGLAACGGSDDPVAVDDAWARTSAGGQTTGAIYFDLTVTDDDTLVGASVPASVAGEAQVHEVVMAEMAEGETTDEMTGEMGDEMTGDGGGAMQMRELVDGLALSGGETVPFEPGGYHIMLLDIAEPIEEGDEIELTLDFADADDVTVMVTAAETAP